MASDRILTVSYTAVIREASSGLMWDQVKGSPIRHYVESLPQSSGNPTNDGEGKIVEVRGNGEHQKNMVH